MLLEILKTKHARKLKDVASSAFSLKGERGNGNAYSLLIVRECLGDVIEGADTQLDQLKAVYAKLIRWLDILFKDGKLEEGFRKAGLDSGMVRQRIKAT